MFYHACGRLLVTVSRYTAVIPDLASAEFGWVVSSENRRQADNFKLSNDLVSYLHDDLCWCTQIHPVGHHCRHYHAL